MSPLKAFSLLLLAIMASFMIMASIDHIIHPFFAILGLWVLFGLSQQDILLKVNDKINK